MPSLPDFDAMDNEVAIAALDGFDESELAATACKLGLDPERLLRKATTDAAFFPSLRKTAKETLFAASVKALANRFPAIEAYVLAIDIRTTRTGPPMIRMGLDHADYQTAVKFEDDGESYPGFAVGARVRLRGERHEFNGVVQFLCTDIAVLPAPSLEARETAARHVARINRLATSRALAQRGQERGAGNIPDIPQDATPFEPSHALTDYYVVRRIGPNYVRLRLTAAAKLHFVPVTDFVDIHGPAAATVEVGQALRFSRGSLHHEQWASGRVFVFSSDAAGIVPPEPRHVPRPPGLPAKHARRLYNEFGPDYLAQIAAKPTSLSRFRYKPAVKAMIVRVCLDDAASERKFGDVDARRIRDALEFADVPRGRARDIAGRLAKDASALAANPYLPLFAGDMTFAKADRFARKLAPKAIAANRPRAALVASLRVLADRGDTLVDRDTLAVRAWLDYAMSVETFEAALAGLKGEAIVECVDRGRVGLRLLIEAERSIAGTFAANSATDPSAKARDVIDRVIANAGEALQRPDFALDPNQAEAIRRAFANRVSIVTGPPGSGKTAIVALMNLIARSLYKGFDSPVQGVALAARAASVLAENATVPTASGRVLPFPAATIHRTFGLDPEAGETEAIAVRAENGGSSSKIATAALFVIEEASMINAPLMAAVLERTDASHIVIVGDADQLPPIGAGSPFADAIAGNLVPVTKLTGNYRSETAALGDLIADIRDMSLAPIDTYPAPSIEYHALPPGKRGAAAGEIWRELVASGVSPFDIAVVTPRNVGDDGTKALNRDIRRALGFGDGVEVGDLIVVTKNNYKAGMTLDQSPAAAELRDEPDEGPPERTGVAILNGERAEVVAVEGDVVELLFPETRAAPERRVRLLAGDGGLPEGTASGFALTAHKVQGSQFPFVILITARADRFVSSASVYTAASRAREKLFVIGDDAEFRESAEKVAPRRKTLLAGPNPEDVE